MALRTHMEPRGREVLRYPCLLFVKETNMVLLALSDRNGIVLQQGSSGYEVGSGFKTDSHYLNNGFQVFKGTFVMEQD